MKQRKKSFGMRISAFVLSFAMVCTLLAGFNVVAFAADDDETVSVSKFYNDAKKGGDGEHLFTKDADEISWLSSLKTWNNEGEAWKAPVSSSTSVWRCYNPNSGEHLYVDEGYADYLAGSGWNKEKLAFYSDDEMGVPVYRLWNGQDGVGSHHFTTDSGEVDWLVGQGWTKEDVAFYGVADASNVVTLVDAQGLQADGTALLGDKLAIVFGSNFGVPSQVAWYLDGAVVAVYNNNIGAAELTINTTTYGTGSYYAQVENSKGQIFKTNAITVAEANEAVLSDFTITDDYYTDGKTAPNVEIASTISKAVVDVTMNKDYPGTFYLIPTDATEYAATNVTNLVPVKTGKNDAYYTTVTKASAFTDTAAIKAATAANDNVAGLKYVESDGTTHYKFVCNLTGKTTGAKTITRGNNYMLVFDDDDELTAAGINTLITNGDYELLNSAGLYTCPYVEAPEEIAVTSFNNQTGSNTGVEITLYDENGSEMEWWIAKNGAGANLSGMDTISIFNPASGEISLTDAPQLAINTAAGDQDMTAGVLSAKVANPMTNRYSYAAIKFTKGIFAADAYTLLSDVVETADAPATSVVVKESEDDPYDAVVTFTGLTKKAPGTVLLVNGKGATGTAIADVAKLYETNTVGMARVENGEATVLIEDVFDNSVIGAANNADRYAVIFVPDDSQGYTKVYGGDGTANAFQLTSKIVGYALDPSTTSQVTAGDAASTMTTTVLGVNQFGESVALTSAPGADLAATTLTSTPSATASTGKVEGAFNNGVLTLTSSASGDGKHVVGTYTTINLLSGQKLVITVAQSTYDTTSSKETTVYNVSMQ